MVRKYLDPQIIIENQCRWQELKRKVRPNSSQDILQMVLIEAMSFYDIVLKQKGYQGGNLIELLGEAKSEIKNIDKIHHLRILRNNLAHNTGVNKLKLTYAQAQEAIAEIETALINIKAFTIAKKKGKTITGKNMRITIGAGWNFLPLF